MNYDELLVALEKDDEELMKEYLYHNVLFPCINGHPNCDLTYNTHDVLEPGTEFIKSNLLSIYKMMIVPINDNTYEVHVNARYVDTLSGISPGDFAKTGVVISVEGTISPKTAAYDGMVYMNPFEVV